MFQSNFYLNIANYLNSNFYDNKISKNYIKDFIYKPSPHLLSHLIKFTKKIAPKITNKSQIFDKRNETREWYKGVHRVDLGESFPTSV